MSFNRNSNSPSDSESFNFILLNEEVNECVSSAINLWDNVIDEIHDHFTRSNKPLKVWKDDVGKLTFCLDQKNDVQPFTDSSGTKYSHEEPTCSKYLELMDIDDDSKSTIMMDSDNVDSDDSVVNKESLSGKNSGKKDKEMEEEQDTSGSDDNKDDEPNTKEKSKSSNSRRRNKTKSERNEKKIDENNKDEPKVEKKKAQKRKRKPKKADKKKDNDIKGKKDGSDEVTTSDEDIRMLNKKMKDTPEFKSIRDLTEDKWYKIELFELVTTTKGERIRLKLTNNEFKTGTAYIHLPQRLNEDIIPNIEKFNGKCKSNKPMHVRYNGLKGKAFDLTFDTRPS